VAAPFLVAWWWHLRRASAEALRFGGEERQHSAVRAGRLVVSAVGLMGVAVGLAWGVAAAFELLDVWSKTEPQVIARSTLREDATPALAAFLVGLVMYVPAWILVQRDRAHDPLEAARSMARRAYLLLVSGVAVVALMTSAAFLVYQAMRAILETGRIDDTSWALGALPVATVVLIYHLLQLRTDMGLQRDAEAAETAETAEAAETAETAEDGWATETIEISAPDGADFETLNAAIREGLPEGYTMRVVPQPEGSAG
jgi:hypothetical protein